MITIPLSTEDLSKVRIAPQPALGSGHQLRGARAPRPPHDVRPLGHPYSAGPAGHRPHFPSRCHLHRVRLPEVSPAHSSRAVETRRLADLPGMPESKLESTIRVSGSPTSSATASRRKGSNKHLSLRMR